MKAFLMREEALVKGQLPPELIFEREGIEVFNRFGLHVGDVPYDEPLLACEAHGKSLRPYFLFGTPKKTQALRRKARLPALPATIMANWKGVRGGGLRAGEITIWRSRCGTLLVICRGAARLLFAGRNIHFHNHDLARGVADAIAMGCNVAGFHWEGMQVLPSLAAHKTSALLEINLDAINRWNLKQRH